jgi:hypothetical protein
VDGEASHLHGFDMTLEFGVSFGDSFESGTGAFHLVVEVLEKNFGDGHFGSFLVENGIEAKEVPLPRYAMTIKIGCVDYNPVML